MPEYPVQITTDNPIPHDVLIEHIAVSLRDFNFTGKVNVQMAHPFDDPSNVVFDDDVQLEPYTGPRGTVDEGSFAPVDPYPNVTEAAMQLRESRNAENT